jgi:AcrR family transcriptional regulator
MAVELRRERLRREMTNEILAATRLLLEKGGLSAISARAIARQLGVTAPAIYRYFPSMDALMDALTESVASELCDALESALESACDPLGGVAVAFRGWVLDHPASFRLMLGLNGRHAGGQGLIGRLPPASTLSWAALCGLALLEISGEQEDFGPLYAAAAGLGALPELSTPEVDGAAAGGRCCPVDIFIFTADPEETRHGAHRS